MTTLELVKKIPDTFNEFEIKCEKREDGEVTINICGGVSGRHITLERAQMTKIWEIVNDFDKMIKLAGE